MNEKEMIMKRIENFLLVNCGEAHTLREIAKICPEYNIRKIAFLLFWMSEEEKKIRTIVENNQLYYTISQDAALENFKRACAALVKAYPGLTITVKSSNKTKCPFH